MPRSCRALGEPTPSVARLLEAANLTSEPAERAAALRRAGEGALGSPETAEQAPGIFRQELDLRREHEPSERWAWRAAEIGATLSHTSQTAAAPGFFTIALRVFARRADRREAFFIRNDRALANADLGNLSSALAELTACLQIAEGMKDGALAQQAHMNLGEIQRRKGDHRAAARHLNRSLSIARRLQDSRAEGDTMVLLALDAEDQNDIESAEASLRGAEEAREKPQGPRSAGSRMQGARRPRVQSRTLRSSGDALPPRRPRALRGALAAARREPRRSAAQRRAPRTARRADTQAAPRRVYAPRRR